MANESTVSFSLTVLFFLLSSFRGGADIASSKAAARKSKTKVSFFSLEGYETATIHPAVYPFIPQFSPTPFITVSSRQRSPLRSICYLRWSYHLSFAFVSKDLYLLISSRIPSFSRGLAYRRLLGWGIKRERRR